MPEGRVLTKIICSLIFVLLPSFASAQTQEYKDYTVKKGDTLWDISNTELQDPFLWPKVWKENPDVKNPDRIYPGQNIKIPLYLMQKEIVPEVKPRPKQVMKPVIPKEEPAEKKVEPVKRELLVPRDVMNSAGFIGDSEYSLGRITDSQTGRTALTAGDIAYIETDNPVKKGDKFFIVQVAEKVIHPKTGSKVGYLIEVLGVAEVINSDNNDPEIKITDSFSDVPLGSLLRDYYDIEPPLAPEKPGKPDVSGYIIATKHLHVLNGNWDIVYLDKGRADGLEVGDLLATTRQSRHRILNGVVQILSLRENTSAAIIRKGANETGKGDGITGLKQE